MNGSQTIWNYRVMEFDNTEGGKYFQIHEVYYDGAGKPMMYSESPASVMFDNGEEGEKILQRMLRCLTYPVLRDADSEAGNESIQ